MCGRFSMAYEPNILYDRVQQANLVLDDIRAGKQATISSNMCPGRYAPVIRRERVSDDKSAKDSGNSAKKSQEHVSDSIGVLEYMKWGLIPSFSKDRKMKYSTFNCRFDSLSSKGGRGGLWNSSKKYHRCLIPAEGYYEWKKPEKTPYYIKRKDDKLIFFAGLWELNHGTPDEDDLYTFTIITRDARPEMMWLHDREPVMLNLEQVSRKLLDQWLDPEFQWTDDLLDFLKPIDVALLEIYEVSKDVGNISNNGPELNLPISKKRKKEQDEEEEAKGKNSGVGGRKKLKQAPKNNTKITGFFKRERDGDNAADADIKQGKGSSDGVSEPSEDSKVKKET